MMREAKDDIHRVEVTLSHLVSITYFNQCVKRKATQTAEERIELYYS